jgi:hypothetical protein
MYNPSQSNSNVIFDLLEELMEKDNWHAYTPDSYYSYLARLTDDQIVEYLKEKGLIE